MHTREQYQQQFALALERLNPEQRIAVDQTEGPVLVIAGPGTGKTHILGARIGQILQQSDTDAANILCLTFTDAGALAMRDRLLSFIGPEAYRVHIFTFHSFCNAVIQDNLAFFGKQDLEPISDLEKIELIREILDELTLDHPLRQRSADPYFYESHLAALFQQMKSEQWSVGFVHEQIDAYLTDIPTRKSFQYQRKHGLFKKGDVKEHKILEEQLRMRRLRSAAILHQRYEAKKARARRYDYNDMIQWVLEAFGREGSLLRQYQERYLYMLVDEFQDTNGAQNQLIHYLIDYWEVPNLFIVGDDDQSIYEFQGARLKNILDFHEQFRDVLQVVILKQNYRSSQSILDISGDLIGLNTIRVLNQIKELDQEKKLIASGVHNGHSPSPRFVEYANSTHEITDIVNQIEEWIQGGGSLDEIAILYARHQQADKLIQLLEQKKIPYQTRKRINVLDLPAIQQFRTMLEWFSQELQFPGAQDHLLFKILHFDFWGIHLPDLLTISLNRSDWEKQGKPYKWRQLIADIELMHSLGLRNPDRLYAASELLEFFLVEAMNVKLPDLAEKVLNRTGMLKRATNQTDATGHIEVLATFWSFLETEAKRNPQIRIQDLLVTLDRMEANNLGLSLEKIVDTHRGVHLLTAHSAKGLEFDRVFLIDCVRDYWEPRNQGARFQFSLPDTLTLSGEEDAMEARRRLFYVAMTRARTHLQLSYGRFSEKGKERIRTRFVDEILAKGRYQLEKRDVDKGKVLAMQQLLLQESPNPIITPHHGASVTRVLQGFSLSISGLNSYLYCPLSFYFDHVLRVPRLASISAAYGNVVHQALYRLFSSMRQSSPKLFPDKARFLDFFYEEVNRLQFQFSVSDLAKLKERGTHRLGRYYQQYLGQWNKRVILEYNIKQVEVEGVPVSGILDKLEFLQQQEVRIVDYKTGKYRKEKMRRPTANKPEGGAYWRQLAFYKVLYDAFDQQGHRCKEGVIALLDPDENGQFQEKSMTFESTDTIRIKEIIVDVYDKIQKHMFYEGCGEASCKWCQFVYKNIPPTSFHNVIAEEMDDR